MKIVGIPKKKVLTLTTCAFLFVLIGCSLCGCGSGSSGDSGNASGGETETSVAQVYELSGAELGEYGTAIVLNAETDMPVEKRLYALPAGTYTVTTTNDKLSTFWIVKNEATIEEGNEEYPEVLDYVSDCYSLTAGDNDFNGRAQKEVTIVIAEGESILLPTEADSIIAVEVLS